MLLYQSKVLLICGSDLQLQQKIAKIFREFGLKFWARIASKEIKHFINVKLTWCHLMVDCYTTVFPEFDLVPIHGVMYVVVRCELEPGWKIQSINHSWVRTKHGNIIDISPWGRVSGPDLFPNPDTFQQFESNTLGNQFIPNAKTDVYVRDVIMQKPDYIEQKQIIVELLNEVKASMPTS